MCLQGGLIVVLVLLTAKNILDIKASDLDKNLELGLVEDCLNYVLITGPEILDLRHFCFIYFS